MNNALTRRFSLLAASALIATSPVYVSAPAGAATPLKCRASMSDSNPKQYTNVFVQVRTGKPNANVKTVAHYKTTDTVKKRRSNSKARANVKYYISGATPGYRVKVDVTVTKNGKKRTCSTAFTPHK